MNLIKQTKYITLLIILFCTPFATKAWGVLGHRIIGQIADTYLTKHTKKEIAKILGTESVAMASNWPDFIKSDPLYSYLSPWHYINFKSAQTQDSINAYLNTDSLTDVYTKINFVVGQLKNNQLEQDKKVLYLRLLIHLVGDVHQPLHVGRPDDLGGNKIKLSWFGATTNLHTVWDSKIIDFQQLSYTEYAAAINFTTKDERKNLQQQPLSQWIWESYQDAEKIYADVKPDDKLDYLYNFKFIDILNTQLVNAGVRLAGLLNEVFS